MVWSDPLSAASDAHDGAATTPHVLADRVEDALARHADAPRIVPVTVPVEPVDPLQWLQAQSEDRRFYWSGRRDGVAVAAVGTADTVGDATAVDLPAVATRLATRFNQMAAPTRYVGGMQFDMQPVADRPDSPWSDFQAVHFVLPRLELRVESGDAATLTCNLVLPRDRKRAAALRQQIEALRWPVPSVPMDLPLPVDRTDAPSRDEWLAMIEKALAAIDRDALKKVVLARQSTVMLDAPLDPVTLLRHLQPATPGCFHYLMQPAAEAAFVGASPERLLRQEGRQLWTEAIAGTRSRGDSARADAALRDELLASEKDRREHAFVQAAIRDALAPISSVIDGNGKLSELKLARGRHLQSRLQAHLHESITPIDVLDVLHPTPAVGGVPTRAAVQAIREYEPFDRGWYAGPVGWVGPNAAEFAVAIRSGLVRDRQLSLFSGAGIVDGSVPAKEWDEIEQKIGDFMAVLSLDRV